ncbi:MAG: hypothetical protein KKG60_01535 [Nanoarchaeota archaeon]|nr:hypothetical protein [Nanoarchaeota archaeon]
MVNEKIDERSPFGKRFNYISQKMSSFSEKTGEWYNEFDEWYSGLKGYQVMRYGGFGTIVLHLWLGTLLRSSELLIGGSITGTGLVFLSYLKETTEHAKDIKEEVEELNRNLKKIVRAEKKNNLEKISGGG